MLKKSSLFSLLFTFLALIPLFGQQLQYDSQPVEKIDVIVHLPSGAEFDCRAILARICTKEKATFSQSEFDNDLKLLSKDYDRVEPKIESTDNKLFITLEIWPKPTIRCIQWTGNEKVTTKRLQKELSTSLCSVFERQSFNQAFHKLKAYYIRKGFFEAQLDYRVVYDAETNEVDIEIIIEEGRSGKIKDIIFCNFSQKEYNAIVEMMVTKPFNFVTSWFTEEGTYHEDAVQQDQFVILNYLQNEGFADAQVKIEVCETACDNRIVLRIIATRGQRYCIGNVTFEGNELLDDDCIRGYISACEGEPFSPENLRKIAERITFAYGKLGYIDAIIDFEPTLQEDACAYDVHFTIEEGDQYRVGLIKVFGNLCTQTSVILHETLLIPGEVFNSVKLKKTEERLRNIGYFKNVNVYAVKGTDSSCLGDNYRDVYIEVEETGTGNFNIFLSYSSQDSLSGGVSITERNFNYKGIGRVRREGLSALRGGGEYANALVSIGTKSNKYGISWTKPYFLDTPWVVGFDIFSTSTRYISDDYDFQTIGLTLRAHYNLNQFMRIGWHYRLKYTKVDVTSEGDHITLLRKESHVNGLISATGPTFQYDSTNHPIKPTKGFRSTLELEYAGVGGDHHFLNLGYLNSYYVPIGSRGVVKFRGDVRFIQTLGATIYSTVPLDERIFLGGEDTVRGYRPYRLGPVYLTASGKNSHVPRGGLSMQLYSIEYSRRLMKNVDPFVFFDAGHLSREIWHFGRISASVGFGARMKLIESVPPVSLGMGFPINARNRSEIKRFFLSFGGNF